MISEQVIEKLYELNEYARKIIRHPGFEIGQYRRQCQGDIVVTFYKSYTGEMHLSISTKDNWLPADDLQVLRELFGVPSAAKGKNDHIGLREIRRHLTMFSWRETSKDKVVKTPVVRGQQAILFN